MFLFLKSSFKFRSHQPYRRKMNCHQSKPRFNLKFAIDGNIAAGKSTLIEAIARVRPDWTVVPEPVSKWTSVKKKGIQIGSDLTVEQQNGGNLLKMFYADQKRWAYTFQSYALFSKLRLHSRPVGDAGEVAPVQIFERSYYSDRYIFAENCFEQGSMLETEWNIYKEWCDYLVESMGEWNCFDHLVFYYF